MTHFLINDEGSTKQVGSYFDGIAPLSFRINDQLQR